MASLKILLVFYSRSGTTRAVAQALADALRCDTEEIVVNKSRAGLVGIVRSLGEAIRHQPAQIKPTRFDASSYDLVIVGTPVWAWSVSSPVRAYLINNKSDLPRIALFCTLGNRGDDAAFAQMQQLAGKAPLATAAFKTRDVVSSRFRDRLAKFAQALRASVP
ncbi:MAG: flavodoxin family protein [Xanthobacteraceae bacterium]